MSAPCVSLILRARRPDGTRAHYTAVVSSNGRIKPHYGIVNGKATSLPGSTYYLRYLEGGKRVWEGVGSDPAQALTAKLQREHQIAGLRIGLKHADRRGLQLTPKAKPAAPSTGALALLPTIHKHANDIELMRGSRTAAQYERDLTEFAKGCRKQSVDQIDREDVKEYIRQMVRRKLKPKTIENRLTTLKAFLRKHGQDGKVVQKADAPRVHHKLPHIYTRAQVGELLAASNHEDRLIWEVFLAAGLREQELSHLGWEDVLFEVGMLHLHAKPDLKFTLKDREERQIPLPSELLARLRTRRAARHKDRLVFPTADGKPEGHLLRRLKDVAYRAGLNCGLCINRAGRSCSTKAVCSKWQLHLFRRTAATRWHEAGLSVPTVQNLLGHSDVETTMAYLTGQDLSSKELRANLDRCFASLAA